MESRSSESSSRSNEAVARHKFSHWNVGNRYVCKDLIGKGSYGQVVKCLDRYGLSLAAAPSSLLTHAFV